jgi:G6PDH family F420-dependent oxidoreductase
MTVYGYTMMCEQAPPDQLVRDVRSAERAGFDFSVISDHYAPWLQSQGHSGYAWSILGAAAQATERIPLMTYVTCPTMRYHPAVVAQKAATVGLLSGDRFTLGLGSGENLNEHVVGQGWPAANVRHEMLAEALEIISGLFDGGYVNFVGDHYRVDSARLWDRPERRVPIGLAVSGEQSIKQLSTRADHLIAVEPEAHLVSTWDSVVEGRESRKIGQLPICWDPDRDKAVARAHDQFRWFAGGWKVNAELPGTAGFAGATQFVTPDDVAENIPCGPDVSAIVEAVSEFTQAGFTDVAVVQIGDDSQEEFLEFAQSDLLPALREA